MKLKILPFAVMAAVAISGAITACGDDDDDQDNWKKYEQWRLDNQAYIDDMAAKKGADGKPLFTSITPSYNPAGTFLMRFIGDPAENADNLQPLYTSTATVNYTVHLYDGTRIDSAANYTSQLSSPSLISGWSETITRMHVGDSVESILPYNLAYGASGNTSVLPYSTLRFNIKLVDIPQYEVRP